MKCTLTQTTRGLPTHNMPKYFAELDNQSTVIRVIVADDLEWCIENLGGEWVETFMNHPTKNFVSKGGKYHADKDNFSVEKQYDSWTLGENLQWKAPKKRPKGDYVWNEKDITWEKVK